MSELADKNSSIFFFYFDLFVFISFWLFKDLIQTPEDETAPSFDIAANGDVMTKSFIDDGESINPFAASSRADTIKAAKQQQEADDSMNDLNKTHELSDTDGDNTADNQDLE